jgi:hypothetical protein
MSLWVRQGIAEMNMKMTIPEEAVQNGDNDIQTANACRFV